MKAYTVVQDGQNLRCIDLETGIPMASYKIKSGTVSSLVVTGDRVAVTYDKGGGKLVVYIYKLPNFSVSSTFTI